MKEQYLALIVAIIIGIASAASYAQKVAYCKHGQTGKVIVIQAGYACPSGYYRI